MREVIDRSLHTSPWSAPRRRGSWRTTTSRGSGPSTAVEAAGERMPQSNTAPVPDVQPDDARGLARARAGIVFMLGLPGSAYLYQGQELGLEEVRRPARRVAPGPRLPPHDGAEGFRDGCRVPMPWTLDGASFGFSPTGGVLAADAGALGRPQRGGPDRGPGLDPGADPPHAAPAPRGAGPRRRGPHWVSAPGDTCLVLRRPAGDEDPHVLVAMNLGDSPALVRATEVLASQRRGAGARLTVASGWPPTPPPGCAGPRALARRRPAGATSGRSAGRGSP